jgi:short-subunit dehydrogenase
MIKNPHKHLIVAVDLDEYNKVEDEVREIISKKGKIYGMINYTEISTLPLNSISPQKLQQLFQANVTGVVNLTRHVIKSLFRFSL